MTEPVVFGLPLSAAFFYFVVYSVLGWCMETVYCSVLEKKLVSRGFLYGPLCPIYGVGVLMMICWFRPFMDRPVLFYLVATVCMSAWEYLVGWFLETTTHIKYWDYSMYRFNLKGRICLWVCLMWGVLSFLVLYFIHPQVERLFRQVSGAALIFVDGVFLGALVFDAAATIVQLVKTSQMLGRLQQAGEELRLQMSLAKASFTDHLEELIPDQLDEAGRAAKARYDELMTSAEVVSRRFRTAFGSMQASGPVGQTLESVKRQGERVKALFKSAVFKPEEKKKE